MDAATFYSGVQIRDRKSIFQAHVARINSEEEIPSLINELKKDWKIDNASFNPYAWRLFVPPKKTPPNAGKLDVKGGTKSSGNVNITGNGRNRKDSGNFKGSNNNHHHSPQKEQGDLALEEHADFCCNGEHGAGKCLLSVLFQLDARGVLLVVSRWKGDFRRIGPARYRHFADAAKEALISGGFVSSAKMDHQLQLPEEFQQQNDSDNEQQQDHTIQNTNKEVKEKQYESATDGGTKSGGGGAKQKPDVRRGFGGKLLKMSGKAKVHKKGA